jgi:acetyl esterase/lipase
VHANAAEHGDDPERIFLFGQSAACAHCASAVWDQRLRTTGQGLALAGLTLTSPRVRADLRPENINAAGVAAYFGDDPRQFADRAPLLHARPDTPPTFVALAQYENPLIDVYALELSHRLAQIHDARGGPMPRVLQLPDHNHYSLTAQFNTAHNPPGQRNTGMVRKNRARRVCSEATDFRRRTRRRGFGETCVLNFTRQSRSTPDENELQGCAVGRRRWEGAWCYRRANTALRLLLSKIKHLTGPEPAR